MTAHWEYADSPPESPPALQPECPRHTAIQLSRDNKKLAVKDADAVETCSYRPTSNRGPAVEHVPGLEKPSSVSALDYEEQIAIIPQPFKDTHLSLPLNNVRHVGAQPSNTSHQIHDTEVQNDLVPIYDSLPPGKSNTWRYSETFQSKEASYCSNNQDGINTLDSEKSTSDRDQNPHEDSEDESRRPMQVKNGVNGVSSDVILENNATETPNEPCYDTCFGMVSRVPCRI